ncbi:hypothetical protein [Paenibacillus polymyxa]|uniref:hypothetical protein n=1 Tax=Paenibacillus polymyxa TaxID=1406 RepID=UPI001BE9BA78|nr:hypothetical protein [Paenibacillus polymyxa]MBT2281966.1 hypothetical protein [Paenibacillus polymyxa]
MLFAEAATASTSNFNAFDIFVILFTILIFIGVVRLLRAPKKNLFAIGFAVVSLLVFLMTDYAMITGWFGE